MAPVCGSDICNWPRSEHYRLVVWIVLFLRYQGQDPTAAPVLTGAHLDTQLHGGRFDGACRFPPTTMGSAVFAGALSLAHAGTTPQGLRRDAFMSAVSIVQALCEHFADPSDLVASPCAGGISCNEAESTKSEALTASAGSGPAATR